ncbi:YqaJ viral recombinase family protein [Agrococcus sp. HG114]|uniref:YqaJ viral recombinase family protein n=1 Tax=Agrococcus sp. HG114 TaxID=2969757 RepID=UPI00215AB039|nr:YqaJ viral recombinase family protein [Agrococcus sp. HG114]MCR8670586.1 YqaJ viral recombinase family protein [Agrococcus sp. HG114]
MDLQLDIFGDEAPAAPHTSRILARSSDRVAWLRARSGGVTGTDAARLSTQRAIAAVAREKTGLRGFTGNAFTDHGRAREPHIARWVHDHFSLEPSDALFHSAGDRRHLATPDCVSDDGAVLAEIKTTSRPFTSIPKHYLRQIWWQQYVLGAERTLFVWEQHVDFVPVGPPRHRWVERDEDEIAMLVDRANGLLQLLAR